MNIQVKDELFIKTISVFGLLHQDNIDHCLSEIEASGLKAVDHIITIRNIMDHYIRANENREFFPGAPMALIGYLVGRMTELDEKGLRDFLTQMDKELKKI